MAQRVHGTYVNTNGYLRISSGPCRDMYVHTLVAQAMIGRELYEDEVVDHINGDKLDARPANLRVIKRAENCEYHNSPRTAEYT